jgi:hypothetical protein
VLKCPDHGFALAAIRAVYPDAHFIFVHRDPLRVLASVARLTEVLREPFARVIDRARIGEQVTRHWEAGAAHMVALPPDPAAHTHIQYRELVSDPMATIRHLYARTGMALSPAAEARMAAHLAARPDGGYGRHSYRFEDHHLDPGALAERFRPYMRHFAIAGETDWTR